MRVDNVNEWIGLGEEVARTGFISDESITRLSAVIKDFRKAAASNQALGLFVFATEAMRCASNHKAVIDRIKKETGVAVEIITPKQEAAFSFRGIQLDTPAVGASVIIEVGGGSAQVLSTAAGDMREEISLPLGTGRLAADCELGEGVTQETVAKAETYVDKMVESIEVKRQHALAIGSGGVVRGIWRALHRDGEKRIETYELDYLIRTATNLSVPRLMERFDVKAKRAATLLPGAIVFRSILRRFGLDAIAVSEFGVREGAVQEMDAGRVHFSKP